ncbi:MAG: amidohydrolase family protein, partial [Bacteroidetes bacterium]|nr:amidohydrolase family protein [Bacteroidota bacterium]
MKSLRIFVLFVFGGLFLLNSCVQDNVEPADLVVKNAKILTIDNENPRAEAIAIRGEKIVAVSSNKKIEKYIDEATEVIDAEGRLVFPGFNDAHAHFGPMNPDYIELRYITDPTEITRRVA